MKFVCCALNGQLYTNRMHFDQIKSIQIVLLTFLCRYTEGLAMPISFALLVPLTLLTRDYFYLNTSFSIVVSLVAYLSCMKEWMLPLVLVNGLLCYCLRGRAREGENTGVKPAFLICMGLTSMNQLYSIQIIQLAVFYLLLILEYLELQRAFITITKIYRGVLSMGVLWLAAGPSLFATSQTPAGHQPLSLMNQDWWYYLTFTLGSFAASLLSEGGKVTNLDDCSAGAREIEMQDLSGSIPSLQSPEASRQGQELHQRGEAIQDNAQHINIQVHEVLPSESPSKEQMPLPRQESGQEKLNPHGADVPVHSPSKISYLSSSSQLSEKEQGQSLNLLLLIPFCVVSQNLLQLPLYAYILALQWNKPHKVFTICMLLAAGLITLLSGLNTGQSIIARVLAALLVSKELQGGQILGQMLRSLWLRTSFAVVLAFLFWFSLLTVNIFHLLFIIVVLVFVVRNERVDRTSYRHRNWKYLQLLFNIFIVLRLLYELAVYYGLTFGGLDSLLELAGISFAYTPQLHYFNLIPLLINAAIGLQYLTYHSAIYATESKETFLQAYKTFFQRFGNLLTIFYYKLIPWASYVVVLGLLMIQDFSLSSMVLLGWGVLTIGVHVLSRHDLTSYKRMNLLWLGFMQLISLQIVLRFAFEFAKFDLLSFLKGLPFFETLVQYQELLGLVIPKQDALYLKTVTKFQLMMSLDLASIFVAFLVQDYYLLLIKYQELSSGSEDRTEADVKIIETYNNYVDFKIVNWLSGYSIYRALRATCNAIVEVYFPFLGVMASLWNSIVMGLYLLVGLRYYLILNMAYYESHVDNNLMQKVLGAVLRWRKKMLGSMGQEVLAKIENARKYMWKIKLRSHDELRLWVVVITGLSILLVHFSKALSKGAVIGLLGSELTVTLRWWLYVGGCSVELGHICHFSKLVLFLIVIEKKCSWFMAKFHRVQDSSPEEWGEDRMTVQVLNQKDELQEGDQVIVQPHPDQEGDSSQEQSDETLEEHREHEVVEMRVSLLFGSVKMVQRSLVMVLVFASLVQMSHPFGVVYLLCAILLNYLGSLSIKTLSRLLFVLILAEYFLVLSNYTNRYVYHDLPAEFQQFQEHSVIDRIFHLPEEWEAYLTFGKSGRELAVMLVSWLLIVVYPVYFKVMRWAGRAVIDLLQHQPQLSAIAQRLIDHIQQVYSYGLSYSPLVIMVLCLWIYFLDYTVTNLFLTVLTIGFIFISFLVRDYKDSRQFWRTYFVVLQLMIVFFMLVFSFLQLPMLSKYCNRVLCATEQVHTQLYKALLLLILQLGLDLTHSHHFDRALAKLAHSKVRTSLQRIAIAQRHNDRKILEQFKRIRREKEIQKTVENVELFVKEYKEDPHAQFSNAAKDEEQVETWLDLLLEFLPEIVDEYLLLNERETRALILQENSQWMRLREIAESELPELNDTYIDEFAEYDQQELVDQLYAVLKNLQFRAETPKRDRVPADDLEKMSRKSFMLEELPLESREVLETMKVGAAESKEKQQLLYLLLVESVFSNWHYVTYFVLILVHIRNLGLLTFPIPLVIFSCGLVSSERAGKRVWRLLLLLVVVPLLFKFALGTGLLECSGSLTFLLVGANLDSNTLEYVSIICVIGETVILKLMGHWEESTEEIECMKMALVRNIINTEHPEERGELFEMLKQSETIPTSFGDRTFGRSELKAGYDYSTLLTALQLFVLIWVFLFYDRMAVRHEITFYKMIEYNQFSSGMVALTLTQLFFLLAERFIAISDLRQANHRYEVGLILKYCLLIVTLVVTEAVVLLYFPLSSETYQSNSYVTVLVVGSMMALLVQALQIKKGLDQASKGFMDRYTWYNGFIYMGYRAIPFLFEFKMFSDWTFTKTALRIFDWIRFEEIFGRLYVAKCNSLFLAGRTMGFKIEWWKKLLMGYPLLLSIILLLFGPLVLFSGLNPLASLNDVKAGYLQIVLRVNRTNEYPLYTNSHITDIHHLVLEGKDEELLQSYDIEPDTVQLLHLEEFSDQYWQISEGSYHKLLLEPETSLYELTVRAKFDRNETGLTSLYVLASTPVESHRIEELKRVLAGNGTFCVDQLINPWMRLDNNNGLHLLGEERQEGCLHAEEGMRASKQYWVVVGGLKLRVASDKYTQAIFGYSVMSFYISIILVIANYFRFLFQGSVHSIIFNDIPHADPLLAVTNAVYMARRSRDLQREEELFWMMIDLLRSPDTLKALTGDYLQARLDTLKDKEQ